MPNAATSLLGNHNPTAWIPRVNRLGLVVLLLGSAFSLGIREGHAQPSTTSLRIGIPYFGTQATSPRLETAFLQGLSELGYVEGQNLLIERRCCASGSKDRFAEFMADLIKSNVDLVLVSTPQAAVPAKQATASIPIVFMGVSDPVRLGLVASLTRPGGNVTGFSHVAFGAPGEALGKQLRLIKEMVPTLTRLAVLINPANPMYQKVDFPGILANLVQPIGVTPLVVQAQKPADLAGAFEAASRVQAQAIVVTADGLTFAERKQIAELATRYRLPATYWFREHVEVGGLMSYGVDLADLWRRAAAYVDKIAKGVNPGDLPVEQPTKFELVINRNAAKALGLAIPPSIMARADQVLE